MMPRIELAVRVSGYAVAVNMIYTKSTHDRIEFEDG